MITLHRNLETVTTAFIYPIVTISNFTIKFVPQK